MAREHESAFGAPVYFSQPTNALLFRPDLLAAADAGAATRGSSPSCRPASSGSARSRRTRTSCSTAMRTAIRTRLPAGYPSFEDVAAELRAPTAAIHHDLQAAGLTYKDMVEDVRRDLALSYLKQRHLPFSEIAMLLGYSELSAFSRAFRRWTGAGTPRLPGADAQRLSRHGSAPFSASSDFRQGSARRRR